MVFITGGSGFIGKHVVKKFLEEDVDVVVLVRDVQKYVPQGKEIVIEGNLKNIEQWKDDLLGYSIDTCVHLAWEGIPDYSYQTSKKNLLYGLQILELCEEFKIKHLLITGSCWEYENPQGDVSVEHSISYEKPFPAAKSSLHMLAYAFCKERGIQLTWLRLFYVYGPGQKETSLIPYIIKSMKEGRMPTLNGAHNKNDFINVKDVAKIIFHIVENHVDLEVMNVGVGYSTEVASIVKMIAEFMNRQDLLSLTENQEDAHSIEFHADLNEMKHAMGTIETINISSGVQEMVNLICKSGEKYETKR